MKDLKLRTQLADCLKYLRKVDGYWFERPYTECVISSEIGSVTVDRLNHLCALANKALDQVFVEGWSGEDYEGYPEDGVRVSCYAPVSDEAWFEAVCASVLPTQYQQQEYDQYLRLKAKFE